MKDYAHTFPQDKEGSKFSNLDDELITQPYNPGKVGGGKDWGTLAKGINKSTIKMTSFRN